MITTRLLLVLSVLTITSTVFGLKVESINSDDVAIAQLLTKIEALEHENIELKVEASNLKSKVTYLESSRTPSNKHTDFYGFLARPSLGNDQDYVRNEVVEFDQVIHNPGNDYDYITSTYTCPVSGYYWFSVTILSDTGFSNDFMHATIVVNGRYMFRATALSQGENNQGFHSGIAYCSASERVQVIAETTSSQGMGMLGSNESSFSGYLIWQGAL